MPLPDFGFLAVDKPSGPTSHDIVQVARRICGTKKIGHGGTLDPLAEGLLILAVGDATRLLEFVTHDTKSYRARILFGITTSTDDLEGEVLARIPIPAWSSDRARMDTLLDGFRGEIEQIPPVFSAVKVDGERAYKMARRHQNVELAPRKIVITELTQTRMNLPYIDVFVTCSAGTYIRSLARDIGRQAGCGATLAHLRRTSIGSISDEQAIPWDRFQMSGESGTWREFLLPVDQVLGGMPRVELTDTEVADIRHGRSIAHHTVQQGAAAAYSASGRFLALLTGDSEHRVWKPAKVFPNQFN